MTVPVFGIVGWKNSGKTTLMTQLIKEFTDRGFRIGAVKHAHHGFDVDQPGRDSYRFREAGARELAVVSAKRVAMMRELHGQPEPALADILKRIEDADLILVEGFKNEAHSKIEARRNEAADRTPLAGNFPGIVAIASDYESETAGLPVFHLNDISPIADFILRKTGAKISE